MRTITLEEHFASPKFFDGPARFVKERAEKMGGRYAQVMDRLCDLGAKRLGEMDAAGIDMQVLSLSAPGVEQMDSADAIAMARETNDYLADAVKKYPTRFAGLAAVPTGTPNQAVEELERRVRHDGFKGLVINGHNRGRYLDDQFYWPILECADALNVPIYLHPTPPPQPVIDISYGGFAPMVTDMLAGGAWGWHMETAIHMIRIICGGVFDRFPKLQFVIGHMGEGLPFFFQRLDIIPMAVTKLKRPILSYLKENVHYTFSGMNFPASSPILFEDLNTTLELCSRFSQAANSSEPEKPLGVAVRDALLVGGTDGNLLQECARPRHGLIRIVGREHDPVDATELEQQIEKSR